MIKLLPLSLNKQKFLRKLQQKKYRQQFGMYLCEGFNLFESAIQSKNSDILDIVLSDNLLKVKKADFILTESKRFNIPLYTCDDNTMGKISDTVSPPGILFTIKSRLHGEDDLTSCHDDTILYFEKITDPGNLGTILRTALWFGIKSIFLSPECVDPLNLKTVRASSGSIFNIDLYYPIAASKVFQVFKNQGYHFIATAPEDGIKPEQWKVLKNNILFFGSEAAGLSPSILKTVNTILTVPRLGRIESLNLAIATGIILYEWSKLKNLNAEHQKRNVL